MHRLLADERIAGFEAELGRNSVKRAAEEVLGRARVSGAGEYDDLVGAIVRRLDGLALQRLTPVINATGVILHTNLGRAPLARKRWKRPRGSRAATRTSNTISRPANVAPATLP